MMNRRKFLKAASASAAALALPGCRSLPFASKRRPNVIICLTDDQGYSDVGFHGNKLLKTPNLDRFAKEGAELTRFYVSPVCSPTRASLLTGRYPMRCGVLNTAGGFANMYPSEVTIAEYLRGAGYRTAIFGKWHLGDNYPMRPMDQGFEESLVITGGMIGASYNPLSGNSYFNPMLLHNGREDKFSGFATDIFTQNAIDFIGKNQERPFFVYLALNAPHHPLTAPDADMQPYIDMGLSDETARFYGSISNVDSNFGKLMHKLNETGLDRNTIVIFMGDNGTSSLLKNQDRYEYGLRGRKTYVYENGIRVPCCIRWPQAINAGRKIDTIAAHIDILPTIAEACGFNKSYRNPIDGISLMPMLSGRSGGQGERKLYIQWHGGPKPQMYRNTAVVTQKYKLVQPTGRIDNFNPTQCQFELYDIEKDPFEKNDIAGEHPEIVRQLKADYQAWFEGIAPDAMDNTGAKDIPRARPVVGTKFENPVILSRQDWQGAEWNSDTPSGWWEFDVEQAGEYEITVRFGDVMSKDGVVHIKLNDSYFSKTITIAESAVRFSGIRFTRSQMKLDCWLEQANIKRGPRFVEIRCMNIPDSIAGST